MRRTTSATGGRPESTTELIERISAERGDAVPGSGRSRTRRGRAEAVVTRDAPTTGTLARRLAPLAAGAAVMLVATVVATLAQPTDDTTAAAEQLSSTVTQAAAPASPPSTEAPPPTTAPATTEPAQAAAAEPSEPPATREAAAAPREEADADEDDAATTSEDEDGAGSRSAAAGSGGDGSQAADAQGWTRVGGDEFNGSMSEQWSPYDGEGHAGNGRRTPDAISVENGVLVIRGDSEGNTGGMSWKEDQRFGKWEMRARFPAGDDQYHPVLILWPESGGSGNGEIDFAETTSASDKVSFFLHHGDDQEWAHKNIDITQWHNYAVEWVDGRVTGFIDGEKWFESTDESTLPPGKLHPTIQLDYFPEGDSPEPTEMHVDYMRIYR